ncbi:MAG TPA: hypothetical protein VD694_06970 [Nitrososphaeraceae archaeon]|nr:hypothetical protein [Nitrososphaeraceae archaeon]
MADPGKNGSGKGHKNNDGNDRNKGGDHGKKNNNENRGENKKADEKKAVDEKKTLKRSTKLLQKYTGDLPLAMNQIIEMRVLTLWQQAILDAIQIQKAL